MSDQQVWFLSTREAATFYVGMLVEAASTAPPPRRSWWERVTSMFRRRLVVTSVNASIGRVGVGLEPVRWMRRW